MRVERSVATATWIDRQSFAGSPWAAPFERENLSSVLDYDSYYLERDDITFVQPDESGFRKPTSYKAHKVEEAASTVKFVAYNQGGLKYWGEAEVPTKRLDVPPLLKPASSTQSLLLMKALADVKDQKINLAVTLAEIGSTIGMIDTRARKFAAAYRAAKAGRWDMAAKQLGLQMRYSKKVPKSFAAGWLELIMGWLPLMSDISGAIEEVNRKAVHHGYLIFGRAREVQNQRHVVDQYLYQQNGFWVRAHFDDRVTAKVGLVFAVDLPGLLRAAQVGVTNPAAVAWELTRLSFLYDWWISIGQWLDSLDADFGLVYKGGFYTSHCARELVEFTAVAPVSQTVVQGTYSEVKFDRTALLDYEPETGLVFKNPFSKTRAATAVSLILTSMKK